MLALGVNFAPKVCWWAWSPGYVDLVVTLSSPVADRSAGSGMRRLLTAEILSTTGSTLTTIALPWFVLTTTGSATQAGVVVAAEVAPVVLFGFASGGVAERIGVRRCMVASDLARAPLFAAVPALYWWGALPFWLLLAVVFLGSCFATPYATSQQLMLAHVSGDDDVALARASSRLQTATRLTMLLGPPAAGILINAMGAPALLLVDALTYLAVVPLILGIPGPSPRDPEAPRVGMFSGVSDVYADRLLGTWTTASFLAEASYQAVFIAMPVLALFRYSASAALVGFMLAAFGAGAVTGSIAASRVAARVSARRVAMFGKAGQGVTFLALIPVWPQAGIVAVMAALGVFNGLTNGPVAAVRLARLAPSARARGIAAITTITWLGGLAGLIAVGPALDHLALTTVFVALATIQLAGAALFLYGGRSRHRGGDAAPEVAVAL